MKTYAVVYSGRIRSVSKQESPEKAQEWYSEVSFPGATLVPLELAEGQIPRIGDSVGITLGIGYLVR